MGKEEVEKRVTRACGEGRAVVLFHEHATVGSLKVFGSPYGPWDSKNNAFFCNVGYSDIEDGTHLAVTHYPAILPTEHGQRETDELVSELERAGVMLHVGGHCHWARGLYFSQRKQTPCVVASICDSHWRLIFKLKGKKYCVVFIELKS